MTGIDAERIARDRALADAAYPAPWIQDTYITALGGESLGLPVVVDADGSTLHDTFTAEDAAFIAAAREGWGDYIAEVERLDGEITRLADYLMEHYPDAVTEGGAIDNAIRLLEGLRVMRTVVNRGRP